MIPEDKEDNLNPSDWYGLIPDTINSLAEKLNFTYSIAMSRDKQWGSKSQETGEWNGMIKDVLDGVADVIIANFAITIARSEAVDYMIPFDQDNLGFFVSTASSYSWSTYFKPFLYESWFVLWGMLLLIAFSLGMFSNKPTLSNNSLQTNLHKS